MTMLHLDDLAPGQVYPLGRRTLSRDEIVAFAREWDPQPFHLDEAAAAASIYGGLIASGWHTVCVFMRLFADGLLRRAAALGSPGVDDVRTATRDFTFLPWAEGWHTGVSEDYVARAVHSTDLVAQSRTQIASTLTTELATVNHISIFAVGYGPDGAHLVHRNGSGRDGFVVTEPLSRPAHARMFAFSDQTF